MTLKEMEEKYGGAGVFFFPREEKYLLEKDEWKYDSAPDIIDGKNILDFYDPEIEEKLAVLEAEEAKLLEEMNMGMIDEEEPVTFYFYIQCLINFREPITLKPRRKLSRRLPNIEWRESSRSQIESTKNIRIWLL